MPHVVSVTIVCGTPSVGLWCAECSLPARITFPMNSLTADGVAEIATYDRCLNCLPLEEEDVD